METVLQNFMILLGEVFIFADPAKPASLIQVLVTLAAVKTSRMAKAFAGIAPVADFNRSDIQQDYVARESVSVVERTCLIGIMIGAPTDFANRPWAVSSLVIIGVSSPMGMSQVNWCTAVSVLAPSDLHHRLRSVQADRNWWAHA